MIKPTIYLTGFLLTGIFRLVVSYPLCSFVFISYVSLSFLQSKVIVPMLANACETSPEANEWDMFYDSKAFCCLDAALVTFLLILGCFYCGPLGVVGLIASITSVIYILIRFALAFR